jgi:hypothetical protein
MKVGLAVMRMQPLQIGHCNLIDLIDSKCDIGIIGYGSTQESRTERNPFTYTERYEIFTKKYGSNKKLVSIPLVDQGAVTKQAWNEYVYSVIRSYGFPQPTDYFGGCEFDVEWWRESGLDIHILDRSKCDHLRATNVRMDICAGGQMWKQYVPAEVIPLIEFYYPTELKNFKQVDIKLDREKISLDKTL